ncbi:MAG TPA: hypothetical protein VKN63_05290 [Afifellaceae bacterium]|jgi:hypothetical protein|nr:hypothetical protein [Afifellaceae bacterium]
MLSDIMITRAQLGHNTMDLHSHATFSCRLSKLMRRVRRFIS